MFICATNLRLSSRIFKEKKRKWGMISLIGNRKCNSAGNLMRWTRAGLRDQEETENKFVSLHRIVTTVAECISFLNVFINADLSVIFTNTFSMMINSFFLSATEKSNFHMYQTRYFTTFLDSRLLMLSSYQELQLCNYLEVGVNIRTCRMHGFQYPGMT